MSKNTEYIVIDENTLCYIRPGMKSAGVLASSVIRGSKHDPLSGPIPIPMDEKRVRPATLEDFKTFRVSPYGYLRNE